MRTERVFTTFLATLFLILASVRCTHDPSGLRKDYPIRPVSFTQVTVEDDFWAPRIRTNHEVTIPIAFQKSEETGRIDNFRIAGGLKTGSFASLYPFDDSDVFKNIEAASYSMQLFPDPALDAYLDTLIGIIAAAQEDDGYLYTNRTIDPVNPHEMAGPERWSKIEEGSHELYNVGHLYEAAVAHYEATGKRALLDVALKNANLIDSLFGWGKLETVPGHQEIEIGLVKLYRVTGEQRFLDLAKFFLDRRGPGGSEYNQMHLKVADQQQAVGHAVRAQYMYAAMADVAALTGNQEYLTAIDRLWHDVTAGKTYITGGIGSAGGHEGFGPAYDLPNLEAYCETCAAIANAFWNYRMFLLYGESKYFDVFEKVLYNGLLSGVSLSGDRFFYPNPLESDGRFARKEWFGCACCPVNITRFLPSLPGYIYATRDRDLFVNLYIGNKADINLDGHAFGLVQQTQYPWDGKVTFTVEMDAPLHFRMNLRLPGWARNEAFVSNLYLFDFPENLPVMISVNGQEIAPETVNGYVVVDRRWENGDRLTLDIPMNIRTVRAHPAVIADSGLAALQRGPVIFCVEQTDQPAGASLEQIQIGPGISLSYSYLPEMLNGVGVITGKMKGHKDRFKAIPYYGWANREQGSMRVWLNYED